MNDIIKQHSDMVDRLVKPAAKIIKELTEEKVNILHMAIGISGEAGELLLSAIDPSGIDPDNLREECGDIEFYMRGLCKYANISNQFSDIKNAPRPPYGYRSAIRCICAESSLILDQVKKYVVFNQDELNVGEIAVSLAKIYGWLNTLYDLQKVSREHILEQNMNKLENSSNARFPKGVYDDQDALERADKKDISKGPFNQHPETADDQTSSTDSDDTE